MTDERRQHSTVGRVAFTKRERTFARGLLAEIESKLGPNFVDHADQHKVMPAIISWFHARQRAEEKRALFWERMATDNALRVSALLIGALLVAIILGGKAAIAWLGNIILSSKP